MYDYVLQDKKNWIGPQRCFLIQQQNDVSVCIKYEINCMI